MFVFKSTLFLIYQEIQKGSGAMSYMWKGPLIYEEMHKYLVIYMRRPKSYMTLYPITSEFSYIYMENFLFFFNIVAIC